MWVEGLVIDRSGVSALSTSDHEAEYAERFFEHLGCEVVRLVERPAEKMQTADLRVTLCDANYVVECKAKGDDELREEKLQEQLNKEGYASDSESWYRTNPIAKRLRKAASQIDCSVEDQETFRLVWMHLVGANKDLRWRQAFAAFYGVVHICSRDSSSTRRCFYFDHAASKRHSGIDALLLVKDQEITVCLNEFSPRYESIRHSPLLERLNGGVFCPRKEINSKPDVVELLEWQSGVNEDDRAKLLSGQLGESVFVVRLQQHSGYARVI